MKTTRAKFWCDSVKDEVHGQEVSLSAVYGSDDKDNDENNQFSEATPCGNLTMTISNPNAKDVFEVGKSYYLDISEAPE